MLSSQALAASGRGSVLDGLAKELSERFGGARIEWEAGAAVDGMRGSPHLVSDAVPGEVVYALGDGTQGVLRFHAWKRAWVAVRRVTPGEPLGPQSFTEQEVDLSRGFAREFRGVLLPASEKLESLQARQTILEGQYALSSAVTRIPDVKKGDSVRIRVVSGALMVSTSGIAEEPAYVDGNLRVQTVQSRKNLYGKLLPDGSVEVRL